MTSAQSVDFRRRRSLEFGASIHVSCARHRRGWDQDRVPARGRPGTDRRRGAAERREPAGGGRARGREGPPRGHGGGDWQSRSRPGCDLSGHCGRRPSGRIRDRPGHHEAHRVQGAGGGGQRRTGGARSRRPRTTRHRRRLGDRIDLVRPQRKRRSRTVGRLGICARRRGERVLDWTGRAAGGAARGGQAWTRHRFVGDAPGALRCLSRAGADSPGLQHELEADRHRGPGQVRAVSILAGRSRRHRYPAWGGERARSLRLVRGAAPGTGRRAVRLHPGRRHFSRGAVAGTGTGAPPPGCGTREPRPAAGPGARNRRRRACRGRRHAVAR